MGKTRSRIVLITGATSGIGHATALRFAENKDKLILVGRRKERLDELKRQIATDVHIIPLDLTDHQAVIRAFHSLPDGFKEIDVLVNNAGLALGLDPSHEANLDDWHTMIDTNIKGLIECTHTLLPGMVERDCGHIINLGSVAGNYPYPGGNVYGGTKAFVKQFSLNLKADLLGTNVRVTNIEPGAVRTEILEIRFKGDIQRSDEFFKDLKALEPKDIAEAIFWAANQPPHVNINRLEVMPTHQALGHYVYHREN